MNRSDDPANDEIRYIVTGRAAHSRIAPLLPPQWMDASSTTRANVPNDDDDKTPVHFLWENAPRRDTKQFRDSVRCYSHLPHGKLLDSKWALGRVLGARPAEEAIGGAANDDNSKDVAILETHCFRGLQGLVDLVDRVSWQENDEGSADCAHATVAAALPDLTAAEPLFQTKMMVPPRRPPSCPSWVIKDADANGAGGVWMVGKSTVARFTAPESSPLHADHRYVLQRYVWPPVLYSGRKCHVRVYALVTSNGNLYLHDRAFLHVANDVFLNDSSNGGNNNNNNNNVDDDEHVAYLDSMHITNCCANSHDPALFAGEICAHLRHETLTRLPNNGEPVVALGCFYQSLCSTLNVWAKQMLPFCQGGQVNHGLEYLGIDVALSYDYDELSQTTIPQAYLLEINAPPSQDTATKLPHAEDLHDEVLRDLFHLWVLPHVSGAIARPGGWQCIYQAERCGDQNAAVVVVVAAAAPLPVATLPKREAMRNQIRWALYEGRAERRDQRSARQRDAMTAMIRQQFAYFQPAGRRPVFFENAGGTQVPHGVVDCVTAALKVRHRAVEGERHKVAARKTLALLMGSNVDHYATILGANATSLLMHLAALYAKCRWLKAGDEIVISTENHLANVTPWTVGALAVGATVRWWRASTMYCDSGDNDTDDRDDVTNSSRHLASLLNSRTRLVLLPHASNILGVLRDVRRTARQVKEATNGRAHVIVDGVAAVPHIFANIDRLGIDWYVISGHKMFGPHLGALFGSRAALLDLEDVHAVNSLEVGTINYEACAGIQGLGDYFVKLAIFSGKFAADAQLTTAVVQTAYEVIRQMEEPLTSRLLSGLRELSEIRLVECGTNDSMARLPVFSFVHPRISNRFIHETCEANGVVIRHGSFLSTNAMVRDFSLSEVDGVVRVSMAHFNTIDEIDKLLGVLRTLCRPT